MGNPSRPIDPFETTWDKYLSKLEEYRRHKWQKNEDRKTYLDKLNERLESINKLNDKLATIGENSKKIVDVA
jgi:hypothetical protein